MPPSQNYNPFERPSFEKMKDTIEGFKEPLPELKEATPEQIRKREEHNTLANRLYQRNSTREALDRSKFKEEFDRNLDMIWRTGDVSFLEEENENIRIYLVIPMKENKQEKNPFCQKRRYKGKNFPESRFPFDFLKHSILTIPV